MKHLALNPHVGIGPVQLGALRGDVRAAMSGIGCTLESERESMDYFCEASIQVEYEEDGTASFIGVCSHQDVALSFEGFDLFDMEATDVFALLSSRDGPGDHHFSEFEYVFPSQIVTLYDADPQYDRRRAETRSVWAQIGCGDQRYLSGILGINKGVLNPVVQRKE